MIDFLIIGGGIAGVSAAARLSGLGSVTLLEAEDALAYHASGRSATLFEENYGKPSTVALNAASHDFHVAADVLSPRGLMLMDFDHHRIDRRALSIAFSAALVTLCVLWYHYYAARRVDRGGAVFHWFARLAHPAPIPPHHDAVEGHGVDGQVTGNSNAAFSNCCISSSVYR